MFFTDAHFGVLTSIGAAYDGTQGTKPAYFDVICPKCRYTQIVDIQNEQIPRRQHCGTCMVFRGLITEGGEVLLRRTPDGDRRKGLSKHN